MFEKDQRFGKVVLLNESKKIKGRYCQKVRCDCGNVRYIRNDRFPNVQSCNCGRKNKFGLSSEHYEKLFNVWRNMVKRCHDEKNDRYYAYGARGIRVCTEWHDFRTFAKWAVENGWKSGLSIERKDVNKNYMPENCCFITMKLQARNKTSNVFIFYNGEKKCVAEWSELLGIDAKTIYQRIYRGITDPEILLYNGNIRDFKR